MKLFRFFFPSYIFKLDEVIKKNYEHKLKIISFHLGVNVELILSNND